MADTEKMEVAVLTEESVKNKIYMIRGQKVMLDADLARIYGYETRYLNQQVKRNIAKFEGEDFMFQLTEEELKILMLQNVTSSWGGMRKPPYIGIYDDMIKELLGNPPLKLK